MYIQFFQAFDLVKLFLIIVLISFISALFSNAASSDLLPNILFVDFLVHLDWLDWF